MKILFLSTWHPFPPDNGSKLRAYYLLRSLSAHHDVLALAFRPQAKNSHTHEGAPDSMYAAAHTVISVHDDPFGAVNVPQWVKYLSPSPLAYRGSPAMQAAVAEQALGCSWDAVVAVQMPVAQYAQRVHAKCRIIDVDTAMTFQLHDRYVTQQRRLARASNWVSWQKAHHYERKMLQRFEGATVVWQAEADFLQQMVRASKCRVAVVTNGVDSTHNSFCGADPQPNTLVYNGSLTYSANYDAMQWFLAKIYPLIKAKQPEVRLTITGSTKGVNLSGLALDESVCLTGFVDDVRAPVARSTLCVAPIRQGSGTRLKILEAMALGTPVVSTTKGTEGLEVADGAHFVCADSPAEFAHATLSLLADAGRRAHLATNARRLVETHYDWGRIGNQFVALVEDLSLPH